MRDHRIPMKLESILRRFQPCFTSRSFENFVSLVVGWVLCIGRRTVSRVVMASGPLCSRHFSSTYRFFGAAMHHDSKASTYGGKVGRTTAFAFGHNWVVLAIRIPLPWDCERGIAIVVLVRLYRAKSRCPASTC